VIELEQIRLGAIAMRMRMFLAVTTLAIQATASAAEPTRTPNLPQGNAGIAARHPGDQGIEKDQDVIFVESFDAPSIDDISRRWEDVKDKKSLSLAGDVPAGSADQKSLLATHVGGDGSGAGLYRRLLGTNGQGYEQLFCRMYVKFDRDCNPIHHFGTGIGGNFPSTAYPSFGAGAGKRPNGTYFVTELEPMGKAWTWDFYTYWAEMQGSPPAGQTWGNTFIHKPSLKVERDRWICIEQMVTMNDVGDSNGEMAAWIDGKLVSHLGKGFPTGTWKYDTFFPGSTDAGIRWSDREKKGVPIPGGKPFEGFRWRTVKELANNYIWVYPYITDAPAGHVSKVWFDQIVVAKKYIGPISSPP
jgi:hypothetical protein